MKYYMGVDVHASVSVVSVINEKGKHLYTTQVKTTEENLREQITSLAGEVYVVIEASTQSSWLANCLRGECKEFVIADVGQSKRERVSKSDCGDAYELARRLRLGEIRSAYHHREEIYNNLREMVRLYERLTEDVVRTKNRIKAIYRSVCIVKEGDKIYKGEGREDILKELPTKGHRIQAEILMDELDRQEELRKKAEEIMIEEARKLRKEFTISKSIPGIGPIFSAELLGHVGDARRFREKRCFWKACGLAVCSHTSSDYVIEKETGEIIVRNHKGGTRGLNRNGHYQLKYIFKSAAMTALATDKRYRVYMERRLAQGQPLSVVRVNVARKLSAAWLTCQQKGEKYSENKVKLCEKWIPASMGRQCRSAQEKAAAIE